MHHGEDIDPDGSILSYYDRQDADVLAFTNAEVEYVAGESDFLGFHVVRDPRDVLVSGYFSHLYTHPTDQWPELVAHRERLAACSIEEGLMIELDFSRQFLDKMAGWDYSRENILELKLEEVSAAPQEYFGRIFRHLGMIEESDGDARPSILTRVQMHLNVLNQRGRNYTPLHLPLNPVRMPLETLPASQLPRIMERKSFKRLSGGRRQGQENVKSHYRKGKAGDWKNHFDDALTSAFKDRYNQLLLMLGYETNEDWS